MRFSNKEVATWPEGHRPCVTCKRMLPFSQYHKHSKCLFGVNTVCTDCREPLSKKNYYALSVEETLWQRAKSRARLRGLDFNIHVSDIHIPLTCPVFNVPMVKNTRYAPSLDRIDSTKGYVKGNIQVISVRANVIKNDSTVDELEAVLNYCKRSL